MSDKKITLKNIDKWILPVYHKYTKNYDTRINVFYGGAGSGKSYFVAQKIILKALSMKRKILVVRKYGTSLKSSVWDLFCSILNFKNMRYVVKKINKGDYSIELINGSVFLFKGLDDSEKIKSIVDITDIVIEEATEITLDDFTQLNLRLRSKEPYNQIHLMFNPVSKVNWVYKYFFENGVPKDCIVSQTTYKDNIHLPQAYIESLEELEKRNPAYYKIYVKGEFATLDKLVFPNYKVKLISKEETENCLFWVGMDFGYVNDATAITWGYYNPEKSVIYITGEYNKVGMTNDVIAETIINLGLSKERIIADSAEPKSIEELRRLGLKRIKPSVKGPDSVMNGIDKMQRCEIIIDERCKNTIEEFENYTWEKDRKTNEYINRPVDSYNHHIDSIRYGIQSVIGKKSREYNSVIGLI